MRQVAGLTRMNLINRKKTHTNLKKRSHRRCAARPMESEGRAVHGGTEAQKKALYSECLSDLQKTHFLREENKYTRHLCLFFLRTAQ